MDESMEEVTVTIGDSFFNPGELTVQAGTTVTWVMDANFPHTVTADDGSFDSGTMNNGQSFSVIFDQTGEVPYYCSIHGGPGGSGMSGTITVTE
jgi:plastocyanin